MPPPTTEQAAVTAADVEAMILAVIEASETLRVVEPDRREGMPQFDFDPELYTEVVVYGWINPAEPPADGTLPLQRDFGRLLGEVRIMQHRRGMNAGNCKAFVPAEANPAHAYVHFSLGAFVFLASAAPDEDRWKLGIHFNVDPDAVEDELD